MTGAAPGTSGSQPPTDTPLLPPQIAGETAGRPDDGSVQIAYLHGGQVSHSWHQSLINAIAYDKSVGLNVIGTAPFAVHCSGPNSLVEGRNMAAKHFLDETEAAWLLFVDTDMGFEADAIERLWVAADPVGRPVVGGLCFALKHLGPDGKGGYRVLPVPTLFMWGRNDKQGYGFCNRFRYPPDALLKVDGTGAAFILIHRTVLEEVRDVYGDAWFDLVAYDDGTQVSEDLSFCYRVRSVNRSIFVHTGVEITHHKQFWLGASDYRMPDREPMARQMAAAKEPCAACGNISCDGGWGCLPSDKETASPA